jgi:hypothetical protein
MTEGNQEAPASPGTLSNPPVPVRILNEYAYCPRLGYLMWVEGEFADSADTVEGRIHHRGWIGSGSGRGKRTAILGADRCLVTGR